MADFSFLNSPTRYLLDHEHSSNLSCVKSRLFLSPLVTNHDKALHTLNRLGNAYLFREFSSRCGSSRQTVLEQWQSPDFRARQIGKLPTTFLHHIYRHETLLEDGKARQLLDIDNHQRQQIQLLAQQYPLLGENSLLLKNATHRQAALHCSLQLNEHCRLQHNEPLLTIGINSACIAMQQALENDCNPLRTFLASLMHTLALLYIRQSLLTAEKLPKEGPLLDEIQQLDRRLAYWIAKDWGMPDDILHMLRQRFQPDTRAESTTSILQKSEHANLVLTLWQHKLLGKRQVKNLLQAMELAELMPLLGCLRSETLH